MAKAILLEEFHLSVLAPRGLPEAEYDGIRRTLDQARFHAALRSAIRHVLRAYPALTRATARLSR